MALAIDTGGQYLANRLNDADSTTGWVAVKLEGTGGGPSAASAVGSTDLFIQGNNAVETVVNKQRVLLHYQSASIDFSASGTGAGTNKSPEGIVWIWATFLASGAALIESQGGLQICLTDGSGNRSFWNVGGSDTYFGGWKKWVLDTTDSPSENNGTNADLGNITGIGFVADVGAATTRFDNFVVDAIDYGLGLTFNGTTDFGSMFLEGQLEDDASKIGVLSNQDGVIFCQGNIKFAGTSMFSFGETLVFQKIGSSFYASLRMEGTAEWLDTSVLTSSNASAFRLNTILATSFIWTGGLCSNHRGIAIGNTSVISNVAFVGGGIFESNLIDGTMNNCTFTECGAHDLVTFGNVNNCRFLNVNIATNRGALETDDLERITGCEFSRGNLGHAVVLDSLGDGTMAWDNKLLTTGITNYRTGSVGTTTTNFNDEAIYVKVASGNLEISVVDGADIPSIRSDGAIVNVVAGEKTFEFTVSPAITGYEWRVYNVTAVGSLNGAVERAGTGEESASVSTQSFTHTETNQPIAVQILAMDEGYIEKVEYYTLTAKDDSFTITLSPDTNA